MNPVCSKPNYYFEILQIVLPEGVDRRASSLLHQGIFEYLFTIDLLFYSTTCNQPVDDHRFFLSNTICSAEENKKIMNRGNEV